MVSFKAGVMICYFLPPVVMRKITKEQATLAERPTPCRLEPWRQGNEIPEPHRILVRTAAPDSFLQFPACLPGSVALWWHSGSRRWTATRRSGASIALNVPSVSCCPASECTPVDAVQANWSFAKVNVIFTMGRQDSYPATIEDGIE